MTARSAFALVAGLFLTAGCDRPAADPPFRRGQQQPRVDLARGTLAIHPAGVGQVLSQTFTPGDTQWLGYVELPVGCGAGVLLNVKIRDGLGGAVLHEANADGLPEVIDGTLQLIQVFDPAASLPGIQLRRGREYAFELSALPGPGATATTCGLASGPAGNSYSGGRGFYQDPINGPSFLPIPAGRTTDDEDLPFISLVR